MEKLYSCRKCGLGIVLVLFIVFSAEAVSSPVIYEGESMVVEGSPFEISCKLTQFDPVKWQRDGITLYPDENTKITLEDDLTRQSFVITKLSVSEAHAYHSGVYSCNSFVGPGHTIIVKGANSLVGNYHFDTYRIFDYKTQLLLQCNVTDNSAQEGWQIRWYKNDKLVSSLPDAGRYDTKQGNELVVAKAVEGDAGNYSCELFNKKTNATGDKIPFIAILKPYVKLPQHTSVVEGEKLTIVCNVYADPVPTVYWKIGNKTYESNEGRIKLLEATSTGSDKKIPNIILQIDAAVMEDREYYTCHAENIASRGNGTEASTYVRVKDKLAALWPFLGICAEVVVLCTIILIYEKKRNKTELDESDTDGSPEQKNTPDHGKDSEVRHRK